MQHFIGRYSRSSRYRTKSLDKCTISLDKCTISHVFPRYSRYQTALLKLQEINYFVLYASIQGSHFGGGFVIFVGETCGLPRANAVRPYGVGDTLVPPFLFMNFSAGSIPHTSIGGSICKGPRRSIYFLPFL